MELHIEPTDYQRLCLNIIAREGRGSAVYKLHCWMRARGTFDISLTRISGSAVDAVWERHGDDLQAAINSTDRRIGALAGFVEISHDPYQYKQVLAPLHNGIEHFYDPHALAQGWSFCRRTADRLGVRHISRASSVVE